MSRPRTCPRCLEANPIDGGYSFDDDGNLLCSLCGKEMYPVTMAAETEVETAIKDRNATTAHQSSNTWSGSAYNSNRQTSYGDSYKGYHPGEDAFEDDDAS